MLKTAQYENMLIDRLIRMLIDEKIHEERIMLSRGCAFSDEELEHLMTIKQRIFAYEFVLDRLASIKNEIKNKKPAKPKLRPIGMVGYVKIPGIQEYLKKMEAL